MNVLVPIIAAGLSAIIWLWFIRRHDKFEPEPLKTLILAMVVGGVGSVIPSMMLNNLFIVLAGHDPFEQPNSFFDLLGFCLWVGLNEETWKAVLLVLLIRNHRDFDEPVDGIIYAMTVALGFAALENLLYIWQHGLSVIFFRSLLSVPGHLTFAAISGYGLTKIKFGSTQKHWFRGMVPYVLMAALAHAAYNFTLITGQTVYAVGIVVSLIMLTRSRLKRLLAISPFAPPPPLPSRSDSSDSES